MYPRIVAEDKLHKKEQKRIRFTIDGDRVKYKGKVATPTSHLNIIKIHLNSVVFTPGAKYEIVDIINFT